MEKNQEKGFVLIASLTIIALMTMGNLAMYFRSVSNIQTNAALADRVQAAFYAETAANYMDWSMARLAGNDADFDPYTVPGGDFSALLPRVLGGRVDQPELNVSYFDNRPLASRKVVFTGSAAGAATNMKAMWNDLPNLNMNPKSVAYSFVKLWIITDAAGVQRIQTTVTNQLPQAGENGAIMWLTASPVGSVIGGNVATGLLADKDMVVNPGLLGGAAGGYDLVVYALGYINGKPRNLLRKKIRKVQ